MGVRGDQRRPRPLRHRRRQPARMANLRIPAPSQRHRPLSARTSNPARRSPVVRDIQRTLDPIRGMREHCRRRRALQAPSRIAGAVAHCRGRRALQGPSRIAGAVAHCRGRRALQAPSRIAGAVHICIFMRADLHSTAWIRIPRYSLGTRVAAQTVSFGTEASGMCWSLIAECYIGDGLSVEYHWWRVARK
jgi:hypothetical protein